MKQFIKNMLSAGTPESSKRVLGMIGWLSSIVIIFIWRKDLTETLLWVSSMLIGLETVTNIQWFKK